MHWVTDQDRLWARLAQALQPGGVLEIQCGGEGNITRVRSPSRVPDAASQAVCSRRNGSVRAGGPRRPLLGESTSAAFDAGGVSVAAGSTRRHKRAAGSDPDKSTSGPRVLRRAASRLGGAVVAALHICGYAPRSGCVGRARRLAAEAARGARIQDRMATGPREPRAGARTHRGADGVNARDRNGTRRHCEYPDAEQVERLRRLEAGTPFPRRM
jgi:hypothetical protein